MAAAGGSCATGQAAGAVRAEGSPVAGEGGLLVSLVVAASENGVIGRDNGMPWHLPDDLKHFKALTLGKYLLMGRRTFESIGRPLPGRTSLVLTRDPGFAPPAGVLVVGSVAQALQAARAAGAPELVIGGGGQVYELALPYVRRIHLTRIHAVIDGDTRLPALGPEWHEVTRTGHPADARHAQAMTFVTLERGPG